MTYHVVPLLMHSQNEVQLFVALVHHHLHHLWDRPDQTEKGRKRKGLGDWTKRLPNKERKKGIQVVVL